MLVDWTEKEDILVNRRRGGWETIGTETEGWGKRKIERRKYYRLSNIKNKEGRKYNERKKESWLEIEKRGQHFVGDSGEEERGRSWCGGERATELASDGTERVVEKAWKVGGEQCLGASPRTRNSGISTARAVPAAVRRGSRECVNRLE